ncbi:MAG TPA: transcriptional activator NhaR [Zoogloea sp.]|jgi:LysR family transcriptional activator of nhaA|uniref:transcriptional activator NhaR n=1 Tax=Zoogloea sp. TaxID=49181 RepID=UPI002CEB432F|nr:transcriptional activator NhaR [Zoogloea sp.]HOB47088.1 transcriptional activator NhaR [Zoogloea sp.]HQA11534.1 transcriptional activator NhaR [Zoogloea sp.]HQE39744.1 transcriptional activator NhaR [Zoogloea sp.]
MNLKHLFYFWKTARSGGVVKAGEALHITPQTISGQIRLLEESLDTQLFARDGRALELTPAGRLAMEYADEMFSLSAELEQALRHHPKGRPVEFRVGVSDAVPKSLAYRLLRPAVDPADPVRIICREWRLDRLLADLAIHRLDLVIADSPIPPSVDVRAYNHRLGDSGLSFFAAHALVERLDKPFPACMAELPTLLPGDDSAIRRKLLDWLDRKRLRPRIVGEFDDTALMTAFGRAGVGAFAVPTAIEQETLAGGELVLLGRAEEVRIEYFAISVERRLTHPCVLAISEAAKAGFELLESDADASLPVSR